MDLNIRQFVSMAISLVLIFGLNLFWLNLVKSTTENQTFCNATIQNCNSTSTSTNESQIDSTLLEQKRQFVKEMMLDAWNAYERYAWGDESLNAVEKKSYEWFFGENSGFTVVNSMSTLWTLGLKEQFEKGKMWIQEKLDLGKWNRLVPVHDVIVHYVGGLLSCYALTNEQLFLNKAMDIAQLMQPAFSTSTGIPYENINLQTNNAFSILSRLSEISGFQLDFNYLSVASGNATFQKQIKKIQNVLKEIEKPKSLYLDFIDIQGQFKSQESNLFFRGSEFYTSLVKSFIQSNHFDVQSIEMYKEALDAVESAKMFVVSPGGLSYAREYYPKENRYSKYFKYSGCYLGAMLSLGANAMQRALTLNSSIADKTKETQQNRINRHWHLAEQITETCQQASVKTKTGLGPNGFYYNETHDAIHDHILNYYSLGPELAESNFILWRLTHKPKYRDNAWQMAQAIQRHCRVESGGYAWIENVDQVPTRKEHYQPAQFLSSTLKYLYLTFTPDSVLPLDLWVFNSVGHPLPICGNHTMYPKAMCQ